MSRKIRQGVQRTKTNHTSINLNKAFIVGRVTKDPELKSTNSGQSVTSFSMATNRTWTDKAGAKQEEATFHNIVAWGRLAEIITQYSKKGSELLVEGHLQTRQWTAKDGTKRQTTEIVAESIQLGARPQGSQRGAEKADTAGQEAELDTIQAGDLPF